MESYTVFLAVIFLCIVMSAYFSATETAFSSLNRIRIKNLAEKGHRRAALVLKLSENYDSLLSTILIGNNIVNIASASLATLIFVRLLGEDAGAGVSTLVTTVVVLIFGEVSPKSIAKESPERFAMFSAPLLHFFVILLTPANYLFKQWKKLLSRIIRPSDDRGITEEELLTIVKEAEQDGGIGKEESLLIKSAIEFKDLEAADILTPRVDVVGIPADTDKQRAAEIFAATGYSRLPLYKGDLDHIQGILYQKDFYNHMLHSDQSILDGIKPALFITRQKKIDDLLRELQQKKLHIAVVMDEFGGVVGIVTLEDILEELVGEIWDEHDEVIHMIRRVSEGEYLVSGKANVERVFEYFGKKQEFGVHTMSGWIMDQLQRIPAEGDVIESMGLKAEVVRMADRRVVEARIKYSQAP